jgi:hypothetical protein
MTNFPATPGSLIRATSVARTTPDLHMRITTGPDEGATWIHEDGGRYSERELTLVEVLHDEGRAQMLANLPDWDSLTDVDKGCALLYAWKVENEGREYAVENYPAKFRDHPTLAQLAPAEACGYVDFLKFDLFLRDAVRFADDREEAGPDEPREMTWDEFHRLYDLALAADR